MEAGGANPGVVSKSIGNLERESLEDSGTGPFQVRVCPASRHFQRAQHVPGQLY